MFLPWTVRVWVGSVFIYLCLIFVLSGCACVYVCGVEAKRLGRGGVERMDGHR